MAETVARPPAGGDSLPPEADPHSAGPQTRKLDNCVRFADVCGGVLL